MAAGEDYVPGKRRTRWATRPECQPAPSVAILARALLARALPARAILARALLTMAILLGLDLLGL